MNKNAPFGKVLRATRLDKKLGLRRFAELVGVSPTYLSQVEQCNVMPPTVDRVRRMAELLGKDPDEWTFLAGRVPKELSAIVQTAPAELLNLLRAASGLSTDQLDELRKIAELMSRQAD